MSEQPPLMILPHAERYRVKRRGHAAQPGTGPEGESCGTCQHRARIRYAKTYQKCELVKAKWTHGAGTDIRARDPACERWEALHENLP